MSLFSYPKMSSNIIILLLAIFLQSASAVLSLQELQAIDQFPSACMSAYKSVIAPCPDANTFNLKFPSSCSKDCFSALVVATSNIQRACAGTSAPPGTVIAHAFSGDLAPFLCTVSTSEPSNSKSITATPSQTNSASTAKPTAATSSPASSKPQSSKTDSSSNSASTASGTTLTQSTLSTSTSTSTSTSISTSQSASLPSTTASETPSTSSSSSSLTTASPSSSSPPPQNTLRAGGGGSPFDQTVPNVAPTLDTTHNMLHLAIGIVVAVALGS